MNKGDWNQCTVWMSYRSPFARRVRIHLKLLQIPFQEKIIDLFKLTPQEEKELMNLNPLGRVPVIVLQSQRVLIESHAIIQELYSSVSDSLFNPRFDLEKQKRISHLSMGHCENLVQYFLFKTMSGMKENPFLKDLEECFNATLLVLEKLLEEFPFTTETFLPIHYDLGIALDYTLLRWKKDALSSLPKLRSLHETFLKQKVAHETAIPMT